MTTLPAATKASRPTVTPGRIVTFAPTKQPRSKTHRRGEGGKALCSGMVGVAHVRVGQDEDALRQRHLVLERDRLGQVQQALVAQEALAADRRGPRSPRR